MTKSRRVFVLALLAIAPAFAACGNITASDDPTPPPAPADSTGRKDTHPWN